MVLLEVDPHRIAGVELEGIHQGPFTWTVYRVGEKPFKGWKSKPGRFISSGLPDASSLSRRRKMRACIRESILAVR